MSRFQTISELLPVQNEDLNQAKYLLDEYEQYGTVRRTPSEMLRVSDACIVEFFRRLEMTQPNSRRWKRHKNSSWMTESDFCFINIRATGLEKEYGNFIHALKLLPALRVNAIHLGPFTRYDFGVIYAVQSVRSIAPEKVHQVLFDMGISPEDQVRAFVDAAHLLGMGIGFDIEPHTAQFSVPAVEFPRGFRWLHLAEDRNGLFGNISQVEMLNDDNQNKIASEIQAIAGKILSDNAWTTFEDCESDSPETRAKKRAEFGKCVGRLIEKGYWTIPSQVWCSDGLPEYSHYDTKGNHPVFKYLDRAGNDCSQYAFNVVTPFRLHDPLPLNVSPRKDNRPDVDTEIVRYISDIFNYWRDEFSFDFVRYDSMDHIIDSVVDGDDAIPSSDRPSPLDLSKWVDATRLPNRKDIGALAERMGNELNEYAAMGFDLMLGDDMLQQHTNRNFMEKCFTLYDQIAELNSKQATPFSITFTVDTHDTGNPHLIGEPLNKRMGPAGVLKRHFISRFVSVGKGRRPKYECMGTQDMSYGLYLSNVNNWNLNWVDDQKLNKQYHRLEDIYDELIVDLKEGKISQRIIADSIVWWVVQGASHTIIPFVQPDDAVDHNPKLPIEKWSRMGGGNNAMAYCPNRERRFEYDLSVDQQYLLDDFAMKCGVLVFAL